VGLLSPVSRPVSRQFSWDNGPPSGSGKARFVRPLSGQTYFFMVQNGLDHNPQ
jgi:hypothetical protein